MILAVSVLSAVLGIVVSVVFGLRLLRENQRALSTQTVDRPDVPFLTGRSTEDSSQSAAPTVALQELAGLRQMLLSVRVDTSQVQRLSDARFWEQRRSLEDLLSQIQRVENDVRYLRMKAELDLLKEEGLDETVDSGSERDDVHEVEARSS